MRSTQRCPITGRTLVPRIWRALATVFGDLARAWRDFLLGATFGQPSANHASITSLKVSLREWRGPGSCPCARSASSSSRSRCASAFSTRSTLRRVPSANRTHAIHRPAFSFQRTVGRCATSPSLLRSQLLKGYVQLATSVEQFSEPSTRTASDLGFLVEVVQALSNPEHPAARFLAHPQKPDPGLGASKSN